MRPLIKLITCLITLFFTLLSCAEKSSRFQKPDLIAIYDAPAKVWESEALPIGNGYMGAMIYGDIRTDIIQVNENTLWSGGPGANPDYNGGHLRTAETNKQNLQDVRNDLQRRMTDFTNNKSAYIDDNGKVVTNNYLEDAAFRMLVVGRETERKVRGGKEDANKGITGGGANFGSYQTLGNIEITHNDTNEHSFSNYERKLDIDNAIHTITYKEDGVTYTREYFMSYPDNVLVIRLKADAKGKISRTFSVTSPQPKKTITVQDNVITMTGLSSDQRPEGLKFAEQVKIIPTGGHLITDGYSIRVTNANEVLLLMTASTNYHQSMDDMFNYFSSDDPLLIVQQTMSAASGKKYNELLKRHQEDYKRIYDKMSLNLGNLMEKPAKTTDKLLAGYYTTNTDAENLYIEMLYYQFGRYLMIASSRENTLPANLQGVWAESLHNPWSSDYHININLQMNYWPVQTTNLSECHLPMINYVNSLVPRGTVTARHYFCKPDGTPEVRGWTTGHGSNVWGHTAPSDYYWAFNFPTAAGWLCQDIWEYYQFTSDKDFLERNYNTLLQASLFWVDNLWTDQRDGSLVVNPSYSPEHGEFSLGASCDQAIISELFDMTIKAGNVLGKNTPELKEIKETKARLSGPEIGLGGQFMEWKDETTRDITGDGRHRHVNHLFWLHPGSQIVAGRSDRENEYVEAMKKTLNTRGDEGTGWSKAWKINFWARLRDGDHAHTLLKSALTLTYTDNPKNIGGVYQNLFDTHPPFQIDGNFGATAGMTEMLVQSQGGYIELLPALPKVWNTGSFKGIKARGNFEISAQWNEGNISSLEIKSLSGNDCVIQYEHIQEFNISDEKGKTVSPMILEDHKIVFKTTAGTTYRIRK